MGRFPKRERERERESGAHVFLYRLPGRQQFHSTFFFCFVKCQTSQLSEKRDLSFLEAFAYLSPISHLSPMPTSEEKGGYPRLDR